MKITNVQVFPLKEDQGKLKGFARITIEDALLLSSLRIYESVNGLFVSFPADLSNGGEDYRHYYYPISKEFRLAIQEAVLSEYNKLIEERS